MSFSVNSRGVFPGASDVSGYAFWSDFMNAHGISFYTGTADLQGRTDTQSATVNFPEAGSYKVTCAADNKDFSSMSVAGTSCNVGDLSSSGSTTIVDISSPGDYTVTITIGNENTNVPIVGFGDNPMGMSFTITRGRIDGGTDYVPSSISCPSPTPWSPPVPTCGSPPSVTNSANGINVTKSGNSVTINLSNYANKLTSINFSHQVNSSWTNGLGFNIPEASDIKVNGSDVGGNPYSKSSYSNTDMPSSSTIVLANLDGGDYNYTFNHSSSPGPVPTRTIYTRTCDESTDTVTVDNGDGTFTDTEVTTQICTCPSSSQSYTDLPGNSWPPCPTGVWLVKNGGSEVEWIYSDGDGSYQSQRSTLTVSGTRPIVPATGPITMAIADQSLYIKGMSGGRFSVGSYRQYVNASLTNRLRFRDPVNRESKSELVTNTTDSSYDDDNYAAFSEFRLYAGAEPP